MDFRQREDLSQLIDEVFYQEDRYSAELRLLPTDAEELTKHYGATCVPMDNCICSDGKMWYQVSLQEL